MNLKCGMPPPTPRRQFAELLDGVDPSVVEPVGPTGGGGGCGWLVFLFKLVTSSSKVVTRTHSRSPPRPHPSPLHFGNHLFIYLSRYNCIPPAPSGNEESRKTQSPPGWAVFRAREPTNSIIYEPVP
eukprot:4147411-Pyramimonas_sp.AAC.3